MVVGASGTNDNGDSYTVTGLGHAAADSIAFRNLTVYLTANDEYVDSRFYAIQAATDIYGACSYEVEQTTRAWYAVGVGAAWNPLVTANFTADYPTGCSIPHTVNFTNTSTNATSFIWDFGDGSPTDLSTSPSHTYTTAGLYSVSLIASSTCGSDTLTIVDYIDVDTANPCVVNIGAPTQTSCTGTMYDDGGPASNYSDNATFTTTISPTGATAVTLNFVSFSIEPGSGGAPCNYDYVEIFDGPTTGSPSMGRYCNDTGSPGTVTSSSGSITIEQYSDANLNFSGFELNWSCYIPTSPPIVDFTANPLTTCSGVIDFSDISIGISTSWYWDFGDGTTDTTANPTHTYSINGTYDVTLIACNTYGCDSITKNGYVTVSKPAGPMTINDSACTGDSATLYASATSGGVLEWYDDSIAGTLQGTGVTYTTPPLGATTNYWVQEVIDPPVVYGGPTDNTFGPGNNYNGDRHLNFDCFQASILKSVLVYANGAGNRTIELRNSGGAVLQSTTVNIPDGASRVTLDFNVPIGTDLQLGTPAGPQDLYRNSDNSSYPYTIGSYASITSSSPGGAAAFNYYYFFYDWEMDVATCITERTKVSAFVQDVPTVTASGSTTICEGTGPVTLTASGTDITSYSWLPGGGSTSSINVNPSITTTYTVTANNACGSTNDTALVTVNLLPTVTAIGGTTICLGDPPITLTASGTDITSYSWSTTETSTSISVSPVTTTTYSITATNACGSVVDSVTVTVTSAPTVTVSADTSVCTGDSVALYASGTGTITWSPGGMSGGSIVVIPSSTTTYLVTASGSCGIITDSVTVFTMDAPTANISSDTAICDGDSTSLSVSGGTSYLWSNTATTSSITVSPTSTATYMVTVMNICGTDSAAVTVTVNPLPAVIASSDTTICEGDSVTLSATGTGSFTWLPGGGSGSSINVSPGSPTTYTVTASNTCGTANDSVMVSVTLQPVAAFTYSAAGLVVSFTDNSSDATAWDWDFGDGGSSTFEDPVHTFTTEGVHTIVLIVTNSCGTDTLSITIQLTDTEIEEIMTFSNIDIYPIPTRGIFNIELNSHFDQKIALRVMTLLGQSLMTIPVSVSAGNNVIPINIREMANGTYLLEINGNGFTQTERIILQD